MWELFLAHQVYFDVILLVVYLLQSFMEYDKCYLDYLIRFLLKPRGEVHNMLRVRVCAAHMGGFLGRNSLNKGPFFGRFSINMGGLSRN